MGAGASVDEKTELQAAFAAFSAVVSTSSLTEPEFNNLLASSAPQLFQRLTATGDLTNAALALRDQFERAKRVFDQQGEQNGIETTCLEGVDGGSLTPGTQVKIHGLMRKPELNGRLGIVESRNAASDRYTVQLSTDEKEKFSLRKENVSVVPTVLPMRSKIHAETEAVTSLETPTNQGDGEAAAAERRATNLQTGLALGMLRSYALRTLTFVVLADNLSDSSTQHALGIDKSPKDHRREVSVRALLDTGAEHCAMSEGAAKRTGLWKLIDESFSRTVTGIGSSRGFGRVHHARIAFPGDKGDARKEEPELGFDVAFDVIAWPSNVEFEAIIGIDLLARNRAQIDLEKGTVMLRNKAGRVIVLPLIHQHDE